MALLTAPLLVEAGHEVTSVIRKPEQASDVEATGATALVADIEKADLVETKRIISEADAVVWSAGAGGGDPERTYALDRDAAVRAMDAAEAVGAKRFIMVSYIGSRRDEVDPDDSFHAYADAKAAADEHLSVSALQWTILGPARLTDKEASGRIEVGDHVTSGETSRGNVARVIVEALEREDTHGAFLPFIDGDTPIGEALG